MPTYEYECSNGHRFEEFQRITAEPLEHCHECRAKVRRLISAPAFILKGGGWYSDGYSSGGDKSKGPNGEKSSADASTEKSESPPAKKTDSSSEAEKSSSKSPKSSKSSASGASSGDA